MTFEHFLWLATSFAWSFSLNINYHLFCSLLKLRKTKPVSDCLRLCDEKNIAFVVSLHLAVVVIHQSVITSSKYILSWRTRTEFISKIMVISSTIIWTGHHETRNNFFLNSFLCSENNKLVKNELFYFRVQNNGKFQKKLYWRVCYFKFS